MITLKKIWNEISLIVACVIIFYVQAIYGSWFSIGRVSINLLLIITIWIGFTKGTVKASLFGGILGLMWDLLFSSYIGIYGLILVILGGGAGFFSDIYYSKKKQVPILLFLVSSIAFDLYVYIFSFFFNGNFNVTYVIVNIILPKAIYTTIIGVFLNKLLNTFIK